MTIDEAIENLKQDIEIDMYIHDIAPQIAEWLEEFKMLRAERIHNGWILCSERLPDKGDEYYPMCLVTLDNGAVCLGVYRYDDRLWWTRTNEGGTCYTTNLNVIAWQPLPAPYKESEQE